MRSWIRPALPGSILLALVACSGTGDGTAPRYSPEPQASLQSAWEDASRTAHTLVLNGSAIPYTATAGHLTAIAMDGRTPEAAFFYVAYTADGQDPAQRPVTFFYNGGPGSSSVWLHLGSFGPRRLVTGDPATTESTPFPLVDNSDCLLDTTDLVYVDAVGTGLSEAVAPFTNRDFWGVDLDAAVFRDFIRTYLAANQRQASPLYLFGESYGTPRTAVLANLLCAAGQPPAGVVLQSSVLDYNTNGDMGNGISCAGFVPTYAAVGAYYDLDIPEPGDLTAFLGQVRAFTASSYTPAVNAWLTAQTPPDPALVDQLHADTGIAPNLWTQDLNLQPGDVRTHLVPGTLVGRYDARVNAPTDSILANEGDPSSTFIAPSFKTAISRYLQTDLGYPDAAGYQVSSGAANDAWDFSHDDKDLPDTIPDLASAIQQKPDLKILSLNGYHDLATPFYQTELDLARLGAQPNLGVRFYAGGHMVYLDDSSRPLEKADLVAFYQAASGWTGPWIPPARPAARRTLAPLAAPAAPAPMAFPAPGGPLYDPYVPPEKRRPSTAPPSTGAALREQVRRKLDALRSTTPGPVPAQGPR